MRNFFFIHAKCLVLGIVLSFIPDSAYHMNLRGIHLDLGYPLYTGRLSVVSELQHSAFMLYIRSEANLPSPEPCGSFSICISFSGLLANVGVVYLFFLGLNLLVRLFFKNRFLKSISTTSAQTSISIITIVTTFIFLEIFGIQYFVNNVFDHIMSCVVLALFMTVYLLAFFFCTNSFLHWKIRLALCIFINAYLLFFLVFRFFNAIASLPLPFDILECFYRMGIWGRI
jgi:hypothetical protein